MQRNFNSAFRPMVESLENREVLTAGIVAIAPLPVSTVVQDVVQDVVHVGPTQLLNSSSEQAIAITWYAGPTQVFTSPAEEAIAITWYAGPTQVFAAPLEEAIAITWNAGPTQVFIAPSEEAIAISWNSGPTQVFDTTYDLPTRPQNMVGPPDTVGLDAAFAEM